jgi:hypothetical protein
MSVLGSRKAEKLLLELASCLGMRVIVHPSESGRRWVAECIARFESACGKGTVRDVSERQRPYDIVVCGKKVQCKYRSRNKSGVVKIRNSHRASGGWYGGDEVDFFAIAYESQHYIVPYQALIRRDGTFLNDMHFTRLRRFCDACDIRDSSAPIIEGGLFDQERFGDPDGR